MSDILVHSYTSTTNANLNTCICWREILVVHAPCCAVGSMCLTLRPLVLWNWDMANDLRSVMARLKVTRLLAVPLQVWQDVQAHHDVLQQLLYLLIRLLYGARRLAQWVWLQLITADKLGVRGGVGDRWWWFRGVGGSRLNNGGLWFVNRAWLDWRRLNVCEARLWKTKK